MRAGAIKTVASSMYVFVKISSRWMFGWLIQKLRIIIGTKEQRENKKNAPTKPYNRHPPIHS
jgi:hypothetical protein